MTRVSLVVTLFVGFASFTIVLADDLAGLDVAQSGVWVMIFVTSHSEVKADTIMLILTL
jgi:hypothetical protein